MAQNVPTTGRELTPQEEEALRLFRMMSPASRAMTLGWMQHRASAPTRIYNPPTGSNKY